MLTNEQKELRRQGLGGSDMAAIFGLNPYKTPYELYLEKIGELEEEENEKTSWGNLLEPVIAAVYSKEKGVEVVESDTKIHESHPYLLANPDRLIKGTKRGLEIKNVGYQLAHLWGDEGSLLIPEHVYPQVAHYMYVFDYDSWDVAALIGGNDFRIYTFERDKEFDAIIQEQASHFWNNHVVAKNPPEVSFSDKGMSLIKKKFNKVEPNIISLSDDILTYRDQFIASKAIIKDQEKIRDVARTYILSQLENNEKGILSDGSAFQRKINKRGIISLDYQAA